MIKPDGSSKWKAGGNYLIQWENIGKPNDRIDIMLIPFPKGERVMLKTGLPNHKGINDKTINWSWRVPMSIKEGRYRIKVMTYTRKASATSSFFTILAPSRQQSDSGSLRIGVNPLTQPKGTGIVFSQPQELSFVTLSSGRKLDVSWIWKGEKEPVSIYLIKGIWFSRYVVGFPLDYEGGERVTRGYTRNLYQWQPSTRHEPSPYAFYIVGEKTGFKSSLSKGFILTEKEDNPDFRVTVFELKINDIQVRSMGSKKIEVTVAYKAVSSGGSLELLLAAYIPNKSSPMANRFKFISNYTRYSGGIPNGDIEFKDKVSFEMEYTGTSIYSTLTIQIDMYKLQPPHTVLTSRTFRYEKTWGR